MTSYYEKITPHMTEEERKAVVLKALFRYPNFPFLAKKLGCGSAFVETVAKEYGIERTFLPEAKFQDIMGRVEVALRSPDEKEELLHRVSYKLSVPIETVKRVERHVERVKSLRLNNKATAPCVTKEKQKAAMEVLQKKPSGGKRAREKALVDENACDERRNALLELAGVKVRRSEMSAQP